MRGENSNPFLISLNRIYFPFLTDFLLSLQFISWFSFLTVFFLLHFWVTGGSNRERAAIPSVNDLGIPWRKQEHW